MVVWWWWCGCGGCGGGVVVVVAVVFAVAVVAVVSDTYLDVRCVWSQRHGDAMSPRVTWESDSRRPRHPGEPSTTKNSSSSRARKTRAQLRDNPEEREK